MIDLLMEVDKLKKEVAKKDEKLAHIKRMIVAAQDEDTYPENLPAVLEMILEETEDDNAEP